MTKLELQSHLTALMARHQLTPERLAKYLGTPEHTVKHWLDGTRMPGASTIRLLQVLGMIETLAPLIHDNLIKER